MANIVIAKHSEFMEALLILVVVFVFLLWLEASLLLLSIGKLLSTAIDPVNKLEVVVRLTTESGSLEPYADS